MAEADRVSVGSIAHILQTTFRELYVEPEEPETGTDSVIEGEGGAAVTDEMPRPPLFA